uniref:Uncharacterized protein n=1 Tax=Aegilops tauschii subsp. strangulata TaxID=200361 RepID=A0A453I2Y9_AEGTS
MARGQTRVRMVFPAPRILLSVADLLQPPPPVPRTCPARVEAARSSHGGRDPARWRDPLPFLSPTMKEVGGHPSPRSGGRRRCTYTAKSTCLPRIRASRRRRLCSEGAVDLSSSTAWM